MVSIVRKSRKGSDIFKVRQIKSIAPDLQDARE
jgi:hypothetical protein